MSAAQKGGRFFEIRPGDARFAHICKTSRHVRFKEVAQRNEVQQKVANTISKALHSSFAPSSKPVHGTHIAYWKDFCTMAQLDYRFCFSAEVSLTDTKALRAEANILGAFLALVIMYPRHMCEVRRTRAYRKRPTAVQEKVLHDPGSVGFVTKAVGG